MKLLFTHSFHPHPVLTAHAQKSMFMSLHSAMKLKGRYLVPWVQRSCGGDSSNVKSPGDALYDAWLLCLVPWLTCRQTGSSL